MKKPFPLFLAIILCLSLAACGSGQVASTQNDTDVPSEPSADEEAQGTAIGGAVANYAWLSEHISYEAERCADGSIMLSLTNNNDELVTSLNYDIVLYNADHEIIGVSDLTYGTYGLYPHTTQINVPYISDEKGEFSYAEVQFDTSQSFSPDSYVDCIDDVTIESNDGEDVIYCKLTNTGEHTIEYAKPILLFYDKSGNIIGVNTDTPYEIGAGRFVTYEFSLPYDPISYEPLDNIDHYEILLAYAFYCKP